MTVLSDRDLSRAIARGTLAVRPLGAKAIQPNSIDLRLDPRVLIATPDGFRPHYLTEDGPLRMERSMFVLGATLEWIEIANGLVGHLWGKSSRAREGLQIHAAGLVDSGWQGQLTLEITMLAPLPGIWLMAGMQIAQLSISQSSSDCVAPYGSAGVGRYQGSQGPVESRGRIGRAS